MYSRILTHLDHHEAVMKYLLIGCIFLCLPALTDWLVDHNRHLETGYTVAQAQAVNTRVYAHLKSDPIIIYSRDDVNKLFGREGVR